MRPIFFKKNMCVSDRPTDHNIFYAKKKKNKKKKRKKKKKKKKKK